MTEENASPETSDLTEDTSLLSDDSDESKVDELEPTEETGEEKPEPESESEEEETDEEKAEKEKELTEEEAEQEAQITRPSWTDLKKQFPGIEKNKEVREIFFREKAYSEVFPTVEDAKEANDKAYALDFYDTNLANGDPDVLFKNLNPEVVARLSEKLLPSLYQHDQRLFVRATRPLLAKIVNEVYEQGVSRDDKNLQTSVLNICKVLFGDFKLPPKDLTRRDPELENERRSLNEEREKLFSTQRNEFNTKAENSIHRQLTRVIQEGLNVENKFLAESITEKTLAKVRSTLNSDTEFAARINSMRRQAEKSGFTPEHVTRIVSAYLGRARSIALKARAEFKSSAMGKRSTQLVEKTTKRTEGTEKGNGESKGVSNKKADLSNTRKYSDLDIISGKA